MTLVRFTILLGFCLLAVVCLVLAVFLAVLGYLLWSAGLPKSALVTWAAACCPLGLLAVSGSLLPDLLRPGVPGPDVAKPSPMYRTSRGGV